MKVVAMIIFQCAVIYCAAQGNQRLEIDRQTTESARQAEKDLAAARSHLRTAEGENRGIDAARRTEIAAFCAELAAQQHLSNCVETDWPYQAVLQWPKLME